MNPEFYQYLIDKLFENGALDVYMTPIIMKKQRSATLLTVISENLQFEQLKEIIFKESSTFGIRYYDVLRHKLERNFDTIEIFNNKIRVKKGYLDGVLIKVYPEYEDIKTLAKSAKMSISDVYRYATKYIQDTYFSH